MDIDIAKEDMELAVASSDLRPIMRVVRSFIKVESVLRMAEVVNATLNSKQKKVADLTTEIVSLEEKKAGLESGVAVLENKAARELESAITSLKSDLNDVTAKYNQKVVEEREVSERLVGLRAEVGRITSRLSNVL